MMRARLDHVALLVVSLDEAVAAASKLTAAAPGLAAAFPGEGTQEVYFGEAGRAGRLLLMEAVSDGPYRRALDRRGPGLHHVGLAVRNVEKYVAGLAGSGWYLLPQSLATLRESKTAWLARPGVPLLVEGSESDPSSWSDARPVVAAVELPRAEGRPKLLAALGTKALWTSEHAEAGLEVDGARVAIGELCRPRA